ncbi:MAG: hypothetical protein KME15_20230 [Drouetiella hepatica Uher 2000/2452]|jgi:hypothetical protein|uniref:Uncharacterized protein n=1 Tax=Drouetiella hepatica Uher 2000/2452 TaxID=904376 RepID=A0A951UNQ7_9CYAN|nr:hypothetical protein [Drouetiella hepatica Uher 2000/2452]
MKELERTEHELLESLLKDCAELEEGESFIAQTPSGDFGVQRGEEFHTVWAKNQPITCIDMDVLQGAIQEERWLMGHEFLIAIFSGGYHARLTLERSQGETSSWEAKAERAAIALLTVYVACLTSVDSEEETDERL